ncbi:tRNA (adenosine(37)-N6)-threonylcarbamoyltransferase complex dimerization subunit type 1 TsaB [Latilactobacillus graminis]|uniref:Sialoglycoprotein metallo-endopeptidase n=2 Tax=Latilactobacillus graminis TaxID=60519 RepID=A0AA89L4W5_9LACO|nr:tRNA (adenosine(37)-N6)-threonylcarbamoyltransferase complex dimerization subunit type 1 TsaB [Latilactobacillus graminis]KRM24531.1 sialoglycoprotein metallo-endopeptidase [Latilactobacillus graminis DSM 20719]QFP79015.1 tRNA (adenosine(37)-N6)-threonylcarbamoyltransferase complex dimerization subunit type 1 TsaB [Latilactobacillus graminis]
MKLLAMDTSNQAVSVALLDDQQILGEMTVNIRQTHSQTLLPMVDQLLKQTQTAIETIDRFVVAEGPGSYTGLRIAVTTAKSFAWTLNKPLVGISSLALLAANIVDTTALIVPLFDARRANVFTGVYQWQSGSLQTVVADQHVSIETLLARLQLLAEPVYFVGNDVAHFKEELQAALGSNAHFVGANHNLPHASVLGKLGLLAEPVADIHRFGPVYLRKTEAEVNWAKTHDERGTESYVEQV